MPFTHKENETQSYPLVPVLKASVGFGTRSFAFDSIDVILIHEKYS